MPKAIQNDVKIMEAINTARLPVFQYHKNEKALQSSPWTTPSIFKRKKRPVATKKAINAMAVICTNIAATTAATSLFWDTVEFMSIADTPSSV